MRVRVSDVVWNAVPGNITNSADVLTQATAPQYRPRPDFDPTTPIDNKTATAVELSTWKLEMDMHFAQLVHWPKTRFQISVDGQCGTGKQDSPKSRVYPHPSPLPHPPPNYRLHVKKNTRL